MLVERPDPAVRKVGAGDRGSELAVEVELQAVGVPVDSVHVEAVGDVAPRVLVATPHVVGAARRLAGMDVVLNVVGAIAGYLDDVEFAGVHPSDLRKVHTERPQLREHPRSRREPHPCLEPAVAKAELPLRVETRGGVRLAERSARLTTRGDHQVPRPVQAHVLRATRVLGLRPAVVPLRADVEVPVRGVRPLPRRSIELVSPGEVRLGRLGLGARERRGEAGGQHRERSRRGRGDSPPNSRRGLSPGHHWFPPAVGRASRAPMARPTMNATLVTESESTMAVAPRAAWTSRLAAARQSNLGTASSSNRRT